MSVATTITQKGQITIPKFVRDLLGLSPSDSFVVGVVDEQIIITPVKDDFLSLYGSVKHEGKSVDFKKLRQQTIKRVAENAAKEGL